MENKDLNKVMDIFTFWEILLDYTYHPYNINRNDGKKQFSFLMEDEYRTW